ncbi:MAG: hypothetical protein RLZZ511_1061 [Cyanobacteriota bacterium]|jgi:hypothetical protein
MGEQLKLDWHLSIMNYLPTCFHAGMMKSQEFSLKNLEPQILYLVLLEDFAFWQYAFG